MKPIILALGCLVLSVVSVGATFHFPVMGKTIDMPAMLVTSGTRKELCAKYHQLFMETLHESIECSEDFVKTPKQEENCTRLSRLLADYSKLRSMYCYDEWESHTL